MFKKKDIFKKNNIDYDIDFFIKNPIQVIYLKDKKEYKKFTLKSTTSSYKGKGGDFLETSDYGLTNLFDTELENYEKVGIEGYLKDLYNESYNGGDAILDIMLKKEEKNIEEFKEYSDVYPFDSILDLKQKIQIHTGIEWFKMCIFWLDTTENEYVSSYILYINNLKYKINYFNLSYDNHLTKNKNNYMVKSLDEFENLKHLFMKKNMTFYMLNVDDYLDRNMLLNNKYEICFILIKSG